MLRLWPSSLKGRLILWTTAILTAMLALWGATIVVLLDRSLRNNIDDSLSSLGQAVAEAAQQPSSLASSLEQSLESMLGPHLADRLLQLLDPFGRPDPRLATRYRTPLPLSQMALHNAEAGQKTFETVFLPGSKWPARLLTLPVVKDGVPVSIVQVAMSFENVEATRQRFLLIILGLTPLALAIAAIGGWFLAGRALAPVDAIVEAARKIEAEDLSARVPAPPSDDELGRLAAVLNDMLARLDGSFNAVRRFSGDAAHELRTPLTILKGEIEVALGSSFAPDEMRRSLVSCLEEVDRLNSLVEDLLLMARMEGNALTLPPKAVNLAEVIEEVAPALQALAEKAGNRCAVTATLPLWIKGYDSLLFRLVFNLAENAIKYTPRGGKVDVVLRRNNGAAVLEVNDNGPGIAADEQERIFDRFYRGDPAREGDGTGLGLALARSIAQLHHGKISVSSRVGEGSCFRVVLPLSSPPVAS